MRNAIGITAFAVVSLILLAFDLMLIVVTGLALADVIHPSPDMTTGLPFLWFAAVPLTVAYGIYFHNR